MMIDEAFDTLTGMDKTLRTIDGGAAQNPILRASSTPASNRTPAIGRNFRHLQRSQGRIGSSVVS